MDTGICYIIDENGYIMFISQPEGADRTVIPKNMNDRYLLIKMTIF